jgi:hypothetical protein
MAPKFPKPVYDDGGRRRWKQSEIINYDRALQGLDPIERDPADERWLTAAQIRQRYSCSDMWIWRRTTGAERAAEASDEAA